MCSPRADLIATLRAVLRARALSAPSSSVAQVVDAVREEIVRYRFEEYTLVWAARHALPPGLAISVLLMDPPAPMWSAQLPIAHVTEQLIDEAEARAVLEHTIRFDQAWRIEVCSAPQAAAIVDRLLGALDRPVCWTSIDLTPQTFNRGVIAADHEHVVVLWLGDED